MSQFIPGQRWVSSTEPELGLGLVLEVLQQRVTILYLAAAEKRTYALDNTPLTRVMFNSGDEILDNEEQTWTVQQVHQHEGLITYAVVSKAGEQAQLQEVDLCHHLQFNKPQDRLFSAQTDPDSWFELRYQTWQHLHRLHQSPVRGLLGGRTSLLPHQLYIAHETAARSAPRVMLADEVGLGKTIEAGMIMQHRLLNQLSQRILVLVPESLLHQWLVEMLRRFNLRFSVFDEPRCSESDAANPFESAQLILSSQEFFSAYSSRRQQALQCDWDLVIVDEAHHLHWDEQQPSAEYTFVEQLAHISDGLILLTATPEQMGVESHFARLRLLDPERFYSYSAFKQEQAQFEPVANAAQMLLHEPALNNDTLQNLAQLLQHDQVENLLSQLRNDQQNQDLRKQLIDILLDHHGTGRVLFRNSRQTIKGFPKRLRYAYALEPGAIADPEDYTNLSQHPRCACVLQILQKLQGQKALLICKKSETAIALSQEIKKSTGLLTPFFHENMSIVERDRAAAWFADPENNSPLLICSEIGSEGRNFQFVHHLILFDLPDNPDLLQQRIGRLDRIGQIQDINIHIPYIKGTPEAILFRWYDEGLDAFRQNCNAAVQLFSQQQQQLQQCYQHNNPQQTDEFIAATTQLHLQIDQQLHDGRDHLLELNSCRQETANELLAELRDIGRGHVVWNYMEKLTDCYGVETEFHSPHCHILTPGNHMRMGNFPELPEDGVTVTTDRNTALAREDMQFLTWEHPMLTAAMDMVLSSDTGNAALSIFKQPQLKPGQFLLEIIFIVECSAPAELQIGQFLPATPIRVLLDQNGNDLSANIAADSFIATTESLEKQQMVQFINSQRAALETLLKQARDAAALSMKYLLHDIDLAMLDTLGQELKRLVRLKAVNPGIKAEEVTAFKEKFQLTHTCINAAQLKLDAIRFIVIT